jgi:hypothetical protein
LIRLWAGLVLVVAAWAISRTVARAWGSHRVWGWALDLAIPLIMFAAILAISARPLFAGVATLALIGGFAFADAAKREVLHEPVVFTDLSELVELVRHPHLYLPFVGPGKVIAGLIAAIVAFAALLVVEPPIWPLTVPLALAAAIGVLGLILGIATLGLAPAAGLMSRFRTLGDPVLDSAALGALAMQFAHGVPTRANRPTVRARAPGQGPLTPPAGRPPDIVLVQSESFFDARRVHPGAPRDLLPGFDRLKAEAVQYGLMTPPTWGASTTRTEFEVLTGRPADTIGLDRFNPYHQLALRPLESIASRLRAAGYRSVCVHPHDRRFYGRHRVMPCLGFDEFHGLEAFAGAERSGRYVRDIEAARWTAARLAASADPLFVFVITMENHGPWVDEPGRPPCAPGLPAALKVPGFRKYLSGLRAGDALIAPIVEALRNRGDGVLGFYGDHKPSLPLEGSSDPATDYAIWRARRAGPPARVDLHAHGLGEDLLAAAGLLRRPATGG